VLLEGMRVGAEVRKEAAPGWWGVLSWVIGPRARVEMEVEVEVEVEV